MALIKDESAKFEKYQDKFVQDLVEVVRLALKDADLPNAQAKNVTADVTFAVTSFFDGSGDYCFIKDDEFRPLLAFERKDEPNVLYYSSGGAMHETVEDQVDYAYRHSLGL